MPHKNDPYGLKKDMRKEMYLLCSVFLTPYTFFYVMIINQCIKVSIILMYAQGKKHLSNLPDLISHSLSLDE